MATPSRMLMDGKLALALAALTGPVMVSQSARADTEQTEAAMVLRVSAGRLDEAALRAAIARELGTPVSSATGTDPSGDVLDVVVRDDETADVAYRSADGRSVGRVIRLPADEARAIETIALLSGNLVRNEAAELIEEMKRRERAAKPPPPPPKPESKPEPVPKKPQPKATSTADERTEPDSPHPVPVQPPEDERAELTESDDFVANLSLFHPVALLPDSEDRVLNLELGVFFSRTGAVHGFAGNIFVTHARFELEGAMLSGIVGFTGHRSQGAQLSGIASLGRGDFEGAQLSGITNLQFGLGSDDSGVRVRGRASLRGVQGSGIYNHMAGPVYGGQGALVNYAAGDIYGLQLGGVNITGGARSGASIGAVNIAQGSWRADSEPADATRSFTAADIGAVNINGAPLDGAQVGAVNIATERFAGAQVGVVNVAGDASGLQLGVVNVSRTIEGIPLGLVTISGSTDVHPTLFATTRFPANLGVKFVTDWFLHEVSWGYAPNRRVASPPAGTEDTPMQSALYRLGGHASVGPVFIEPGIGYGFESPLESFSSGQSQQIISYRAVVGAEAEDYFGAYVGGGAVQTINTDDGASDLELELLAGVQFF